mgnify:CR=1 FL=1
MYIGVDPMKGTYRRDYEGDFLCSEEAVRAMFADQRDGGTDTEVLDNMGLDALNTDTIKGYRIVFEQLHQGHPWNLFPNYFLDYREESEDKSVRWLFRTHSDEGDWSGNLYDFYYKVINRIDDDIAVPFVNRKDGYWVDRVDVHAALGEAVANALAHSNYYERRGVVVVKKGKEITISNPGTIRITKEEFYAGGNSDPRNPNILKMFGFVNVGERAGSGVDKIMTAWKEQNWKKPEFDFSVRADRVTLKLEVGQVVYIPGAADLRVEEQTLEQKTSLLSEKEEAILHYIFERGSISTGKAAEVCGYKSRTSARKVIDEMAEKGYIVKTGKGASVRYSICGEKVVKK